MAFQQQSVVRNQDKTAPDPASLRQALDHSQQLEHLLEQEFNSLKSRDLESFEAGQPVRERLLTAILQVAEALPEDIRDQHPIWAEVRQALERCRDLHRRNELLIQHQLSAIRQTLQALSGQDESLETYDRLGKLARRQRPRWIDDG